MMLLHIRLRYLDSLFINDKYFWNKMLQYNFIKDFSDIYIYIYI